MASGTGDSENGGTTFMSVPVIIQLEEEPPVPMDTTMDSSDQIMPQIGNPVLIAVAEDGDPGKFISPIGGRGDGFGTLSKSLLGADLLQKPASLAMPPPSSTTVKKARNLVSPGMSMVKWMKLQEGKHRPPTRKKIPLSEIAKHDKESDCWMVIRNCVYDVTEYIPYHPGGIPELMKGAGKDATALFNEVHRWVNFDSILKSCLLGYLLIDVGESFDETEETSGILKANAVVPLALANRATRPVAKFSQNDSLLVFQVDAMQDEDELSEDSWSISVLNRERFLLKVILKPPDLWMAHVKLLEMLNDDTITVNFQNSFKRAVITLNKPSIGKWKSLGAPLQDNNRLLDSRQTQIDDFCSGTIIRKQNITHDVILITVKLSPSSLLGIPVGFHVKLRLDETGVARKYTPVTSSIETDISQDSLEENRRVLYFIIKIYPDGLLTKQLGLLNVNAQLEVGAVAGRYDHSFLIDCDTLVLFAGGSGVTPFIKILNFLRKRSISYPIRRIVLIFFNHTEADVIWRDQWLSLAFCWDIFHFVPVISRPSENWDGLTGRVDSIQLFESVLLKVFTDELGVPEVKVENCQIGKFKAMLCGSSGFNEACVGMLKTQSMVEVTASEEDIFIF